VVDQVAIERQGDARSATDGVLKAALRLAYQSALKSVKRYRDLK
jgi:hypothetical protein